MFENGLFKPRLYGNIGQLPNEFLFWGLGIAPKVDFTLVFGQ